MFRRGIRSEKTAEINGIKCKVCDVTQDAGIIPTLAVVSWLGWMSILIFSSIYFLFFSSKTGAKAFISLCAVSILLPRRFPKGIGVKIGNWIANQTEKYFGLKTTVEEHSMLEMYALQNKGVIFAVEPHYVLPYGVFAFNSSLKRFPSALLGEADSALMTSAVFNLPFIKQAYSWLGGGPVDAKTFKSKLDRAESLAFNPGGVQEVLMMDPSKPNDIILYLSMRKGFIKIALEYGAPIVPVFIFNYDGSYDWFLGTKKVLAGLWRKAGFAPIFFTGRFGIPFFIPKPNKLHVVCGKPIDIPKISNSKTSTEDIQTIIDKYHAKFCQEMLALYDRHKIDAGYDSHKVVLV